MPCKRNRSFQIKNYKNKKIGHFQYYYGECMSSFFDNFLYDTPYFIPKEEKNSLKIR